MATNKVYTQTEAAHARLNGSHQMKTAHTNTKGWMIV